MSLPQSASLQANTEYNISTNFTQLPQVCEAAAICHDLLKLYSYITFPSEGSRQVRGEWESSLYSLWDSIVRSSQASHKCDAIPEIQCPRTRDRRGL